MPLTKVMSLMLEDGPLTGSLLGTASFALTASYALNGGGGGTASLLTGQTFYVTTPSTAFSLSQVVVDEDQVLVMLNGLMQSRTSSYIVSSSTLTFTSTIPSGALVDVRFLNANNMAGPAVSSSYAATASYVINGVTASYVATAQTASYVTLAQTASYVLLAQTASYVTLAQTASYIATASYALAALSASYAPNIYVLPSNVVSASAQLSNGGGTAFSNSNNLTVGQVTASAISVTTLSVITVTSSIDYASGSNIFGTKSTDTQLFTGSVSMSGSLGVTGLTTINSNSSALTAGPTTTLLQVGGADSTNTRVTVDSFAGVPVFSGRRANGTNASKTAVVSGNIISSFSAFGYGSTAYSSGAGGFMGFTAAENWTDTAIGTNASITLVPTGSTAQTTSFVFYNNGNLSVPGNVGIGTASPSASLVINKNTAAVLPPLTGSLLQVIGADANPSAVEVVAFGSNLQPRLNFRRATGTAASPSAVSGEVSLGFMVGTGYDGTSWSSNQCGINLLASETWTSTAHGTHIAFTTTPLGSTTTSEVVRINAAGNVGIGTSSPAAKLHISGTNAGIIFDRITTDVDPSGIQGSIYVKENGISNYEAMLFRATGYRWQSDDGTDRMLINSSGNVGIGTSTMTKRLHIYSGESAVGASQFNVEGYIGGYGAGITFTSLLGSTSTLKEMARITADGEAAWNATASTQDAGLRFYTTSQGTTAERMRIYSDGKVGIGTTSPSFKLEIRNDSAATTSLDATAIKLYNNSDGGSGIEFSNGVAGKSKISFGVTSSGGGTDDTYFAFSTSVDASALTERVRITNSGNLGIGTSSPAAKLHISGDADTRIQIDATTTQGIYFTKAGVNNGTYRVDTNGNFEWYTKTVSQAMSLTAAGSLLVGTTSALNGSIGLSVQGAQGGAGQAVATIYNSDASDTAPALSLSKASGTTSSSARFIQFYASGFGTAMGGIVGNGSGNVQFASISDAREKTNIQSITGSLDKVLALKPVSFDWISNSEHTPAGFIAQDVKEVFPEFVVENMANEGSEQRYGLTGGLNNGVTAHLVKALQELNANLVAQVAALSQRLAALETK